MQFHLTVNRGSKTGIMFALSVFLNTVMITFTTDLHIHKYITKKH